MIRHKIYGDGIFLHRYESEFTEMLYNAAMESRGGAFTYWMPWCHENYSIEDSESFVKSTTENWQDETQFGFAIFDAGEQDFLGGIGLNQPNRLHKFYNLGYWVRPSKQNRGVASKATRALAKAAFEDLPINRIEIIAAVENKASHRAAEKAGAAREGVLRKRLVIGGRIHDAVMFSFIREDFEYKV